jgi:uncharacterized membrane protein YgdD (TMEM256/DUF423 family)
MVDQAYTSKNPIAGTLSVSASPISRLFLIIVALLGASGVGIGAYAAHGLGTSLEKQNVATADIEKRVDQAETGVRYHMFHTLAMLVLVLTDYLRRSKLAFVAAVLMIAGIVLFSGVLYLIAIVDSKWHYLVPFGGMAFILGWLALGMSALTIRNAQ